jgi:hypothetical protein
MIRPKGSPITSFAQAREMRAAQRLTEAVKKPAILSVTDLRDGLKPLRANRSGL